MPRLSSIAALALVAAAAAAPAVAYETKAKQALMIDFETGTELFAKNADEVMYPASMTKIMTAYLLFEEIRKGKLKLDDQLPVSEKAWRMGGSKMFVGIGNRVPVEALIRGIVVQSGNDSSVVVAEAIAGSEEAFAERMTAKAREMGLKVTTFRNATGWPDPEHVTTSRELAELSRRVIADDHEYYHYYAEKEFVWNNIRQGNRNPLVYKDMHCDGLKTGHTEQSGYGLVASCERDGRRLILVLNGMSSMQERATESEKLIEWGFREFGNYALFRKGAPVETAEVWLGQAPSVGLVLDKDLVVTLPRRARQQLKVIVRYDGPVPAPIAAGQPIARLVLTAPDMAPIERPLYAANAVEGLDFFGRIQTAVSHLVWGPGS
ncbi:MAG: D-alanyl-D-alanine carboxypeptidase family protein [Alphaproteobacteria bacterium]